MAGPKSWQFLVAEALLALTIGCGGGSSNTQPPPPPPTPKAEFLYAKTVFGSAPNFTDSLLIYKIDPSTGALTSTSTLSLPPLPSSIFISPSSKFLYVSSSGLNGNFIDIYSINATSGALTSSGRLDLAQSVCPPLTCPPAVNGPGPLITDPSGKFLFYGSAALGSPNQVIGSLSVDTAGMLSVAPGSPHPVSEVPFVLAVPPAGNLLFVENVDPSDTSSYIMQSISEYTIGANGTLTPTANSPVSVPSNSGIGSFKFHPSGQFLYASSPYGSGGILAWNVNSTTGDLTPINGSPFLSGVRIANIILDSTGKFLYLTFGFTHGISVFRIDQTTGGLSLVTGSPFSSASYYSSISMDPSGKFLFTGNPRDSTIEAFSVDATTGGLTAVGSPVAIGGQATGLVSVKGP